MRHGFPHRADHDERKRIAGRAPQRAGVDGGGRNGNIRKLDGVIHREGQ